MVFLIIYPFIKIKLLDLSKKNVNNKVLYDYLNKIKINETTMNILNYSTILPDYSESCQVRLLNGGCNDLLCSGHFSIVCLIYLLIIKYNFINSTYNNYLIIITILYGFIPILTKKHYTIDILVAVIIVLWINNYIP